jgi:hypothetical protein
MSRIGQMSWMSGVGALEAESALISGRCMPARILLLLSSDRFLGSNRGKSFCMLESKAPVAEGLGLLAALREVMRCLLVEELFGDFRRWGCS